MSNLLIRIVSFFIGSNTVIAQIPVEQFKIEISQLTSQNDITSYWESLRQLDQDVLLRFDSSQKLNYDSLSITNQIKVFLMFDIHGEKAITKNNIVPTLVQAHNKIAKASLPLWPLIYNRLEQGQEKLNGNNELAYALENISLPYYRYSLFGQDSIYSQLVHRLDNLKNNSVPKKLEMIYEEQKLHRQLNIVQSLGEWNIEPFEDFIENDCFRIDLMSDGNLYYSYNGYIHKFAKVSSFNDYTLLELEEDPFMWGYKLTKQGHLHLLNDMRDVLISYSRCLKD